MAMGTFLRFCNRSVILWVLWSYWTRSGKSKMADI